MVIIDSEWHDLENSIPATSTTLYRLASISKPLTATAAMVLYERGELDLDAPVQRYCPSAPLARNPYDRESVSRKMQSKSKQR